MNNERDYAEKVIEKLRNVLPEGAKAEIKEVTKGDGSARVGIAIEMPGSQIAICAYVDQCLEKGISPEEHARNIMQCLGKPIPFSIEGIEKYAPEMILPRLVNAKSNPHIEETCVTRRVMEDLLLYYVREIPSDMTGHASFKIKKDIADIWNVTEEELYKTAMENLRKTAMGIKDINEYMMSIIADNGYPMPVFPMFPKGGIENLLCVTNKSKFYGAACILLPEIQKELCDRLGNFIVIPSSVHEVLVVPEGFGIDSCINSFINEVNADELKPEDVLSDHAYLKRWNDDFEALVA